MAMCGLALKNLQHRISSSSSSVLNPQIGNRGVVAPTQLRWGSGLVRRLSTSASEKVSDEESSQGQQVAVKEESSNKFNLFPSTPTRGLWTRGLWRNDNNNNNNNRHLTPFSLQEIVPSGLGNALQQAKERLNKLFEKLSPSGLIGRLKEKDDAYKLQYELPGLAKDDVKINIVDGFLIIIAEPKEEEEEEEEEEEDEEEEEEEEEEEGSDDEHWSPTGYGYYNAILLFPEYAEIDDIFLLPDDAMVDDIKAEMKNGMLTIIIPRTEKPKKDVKEVKIQ